MPAGRPAKRAADPAASSPGDAQPVVPAPAVVSSPPHSVSTAQGKVKLPRIDSKNHEDFSAQVKNRLNQYTRTGQACDRCKVRKIRCDALPQGCSHCLQSNLECYVTDRVTGRTERRGYLQELERTKMEMEEHIRDLEKVLANHGIEVKPWNYAPYGHPPSGITYDQQGHPIEDAAEKDSWAQVGSVWVRNHQHRKKMPTTKSITRSRYVSPPAALHLGVGPDSAPLSSIKGTQLTILGTTIDLTSFDVPDIDEPSPGAEVAQPLYNKSIQAFLQSMMNINPQQRVDLPPKEEAFKCSEWYFFIVFPFYPVLHKPTYMALLARIYDDPTFEPSTPELVIVHMVLAIIYYQQAMRSPQSAVDANDISNRHYHYAVGKFFELASLPSVTAVQAMAMIAAHARSFPKPGVGSLVTRIAMHRAIDLNLHRSIKRPGEPTDLNNEIRKRTWWTILAVSVTLDGRLGRPMPIAVEEYDVDFPEAIADEALTEDGVDTASKAQCTYHVGLAALRMTPLFMEMYSNIYSPKREPNNYIPVVRALEEQLEQWRADLHESLLSPGPGGENQMYQLYVQMVETEFRLCLRHPSVAMTNDPKMCAENARICEEAAAKMLDVVRSLDKLKCLDLTWYQMSVYAAAMFTTLVAHWERRYEASKSEISHLKSDMEDWLTVIHSIASSLGSGILISRQLRGKVEATLQWIERDQKTNTRKLPTRPAAPSQTQSATATSTAPSPTEIKSERPAVTPPYPAPAPVSAPPAVHTNGGPPPAPAPSMAKDSPPQRHQPRHQHLHHRQHHQQQEQQHDHRPPPPQPQQPLPPPPPQQQQQQQQHAHYYPDSSGHNGGHSGGGAYHHLTYSEPPPQASTMAHPSPYGPNAGYMYSGGAHAHAHSHAHAHAHAGHGGVNDVSSVDDNPLLTFASHATQHVVDADANADPFIWRQPTAQGTNWQEWAAAMANNSDRFNPNALIGMGSVPTRDPHDPVGQHDGSLPPELAPMPTGPATQWPMLLWSHHGPGAA